MAGIEVNRQMLDFKLAEAMLAIRHAFEKVEILQQWMTNHPAPGPDLLSTPIAEGGQFGYTVDEAYAIRLVCQNFNAMRLNNASDFAVATQLTGLE